MTAKQFFKSVSFKSIITLLCVLLVSGIFLTVAFAFLEVPQDERRDRAIAKIYGEEKKTSVVTITADNEKQGQAVILEAYKVNDDGNFLVKSKGKGGFGGTVTCWVRVDIANNAISKVSKVVIETSDGETQLSQIDFLSKYSSTTYTDGLVYGADNGFITTGSTLSSTAINNAVNGAVSFVKIVGLGAKAEDIYKDFAFHYCIDMAKTKWDRKGDDIAYSIVTYSNSPAGSFEMTITVGADKKISAYNITKFGSTDGEEMSANDFNKLINTSLYIGKGVDFFKGVIGDDGSKTGNDNFANNGIKTGATYSNYLCLAAGAFATANYDYIKNTVFFTKSINMDKTNWTVVGDEVHYTIVTQNNAPAGSFEMTITVGADKKISAYNITKFGSTDGEEMSANDFNKLINASLYIGKGVDFFKGVIGNDGKTTGNDNFESNSIKTGATYSNYLCLAAGAFATANYDYCLNTPKGGK